MRLGLMIGYSGARMYLPMDLIQAADQLGYHALWTSEAWGSDAVTPLAWIGAQTERIGLGTAIMQMPARTPAMTAMTAMTLDQLSGGRMLLGLGMSGPQVVEGWHGVSYAKPLSKTREYVAIMRQIFARRGPLTFEGTHYEIPYNGDDATGLGKPLKSILHGRADIPIYIASIGPKNVQLTAEIADGWLPIFFSPRFYETTFKDDIEAGFANAAKGKSMDDFDIAPMVTVVIGDDLEMCFNQCKPLLALYIGGMGAKDKNFYNELTQRFGYEAAAAEIQDLYLSGKRAEAIAAVPDELVDELTLCGPRERIRDRLAIWAESPANTLIIQSLDLETVRTMAELVL